VAGGPVARLDRRQPPRFRADTANRDPGIGDGVAPAMNGQRDRTQREIVGLPVTNLDELEVAPSSTAAADLGDRSPGRNTFRCRRGAGQLVEIVQ